MKYRKLSASGDYSFGRGLGDFYINQPEAVAQAVGTRMRLWTGDYFLDTSEGTAYATRVLGTGTVPLYDIEMRSRIAGTQGVLALTAYASQRDGEARSLGVQASISTIYGQAAVSSTPYAPPSNALVPMLGLDGQQLLGLDGAPLVGPESGVYA